VGVTSTTRGSAITPGSTSVTGCGALNQSLRGRAIPRWSTARIEIYSASPMGASHSHESLLMHGSGLAICYPARTTTPAAPDGLKNLPTIVVYGAQEYPPFKAEGAVALCLFGVGVVSFAGCGVETLASGRYPYLVHSGHPFFCGPGLGVLPHPRGRFLSMLYFTTSSPFCNLIGAFLVQ
jgi:hypothetical protein